MMLLFDVGNTHTHVGVADQRRITRQTNLSTRGWQDGSSEKDLAKWMGKLRPVGAALCSVVPQATPRIGEMVERRWGVSPFELRWDNATGIDIDYPKPATIGADRLANAIAARRRYGAPVLVLDFGTAVTLDVVNERGAYVGGVIAPGLAAMTEYLHERTALLPRIRIREVRRSIGRSTEEAMLIGAVHGYRGLIRELIQEVRVELGRRRVPVVATGGYAVLMAKGLDAITAVDPKLTLEGLRQFAAASAKETEGQGIARRSR